MRQIKEAQQINRLLMLLLQREVMTVKSLSEKIRLTEKTTRSRLDFLDRFLQENQLGSIARKSRIGVWLEVEKGKEPQIIDLISDSLNFNIESSYIQMIKLFLVRPEKVFTLNELSENLYLSIPTVSKLVEDVRVWFSHYKISLKRQTNKGHWLEFDESNYRTSLMNYMLEHIDRDELFQKADQLLIGNDVSFIKSKIVGVEKNWGIKLNNRSFLTLVLSLSISIYRQKLNKIIELSFESNIKDYNEYHFVNAIIEQIESKTGISFPEAEKHYQVFQLLGCSRIDSAKELRVEDKIVHVVSRIIETVGEIINVDMRQDEMLAKGLQLHLKPALFRMKYGIKQKNDQYLEIRQEYPEIFKAVWSTSIILDEEYGVQVNEGEIAYITLYIQAAIERNKNSMSVLLVSSKSNAQNHLLIERLKNRVFGDKPIDVISYHSISQSDLEKYQLVLTTDDVKIQYKGNNVIRINSLLTDEDARKMNNAINELLTSKVHRYPINDAICHALFSHDLIFRKKVVNHKNDAISLLLDALENKGSISSLYRETVFQREHITQTSIGDSIAIPHGNQKEVNEAKVAILILDEPVYWGDGEWVNIVLLLAMKINTISDEHVTRKFYEHYIKMLSKKEVNQQFLSMSNVEIYKSLIR